MTEISHEIVKVRKRGEIIIPKEYRDSINIIGGSLIKLILHDNGSLELIKVIPHKAKNNYHGENGGSSKSGEEK